MANNEYSPDDFPHRQESPVRALPLRDAVSRLVDELLELEAKTHPMNGHSIGKGLDSIEALFRASQLLQILVGWAVDHQAGLVCTDTEIVLWAEDEEAQRLSDDHQHEAAGSAYLRKISISDHGGNAVTNRRVIAAVTKWAPILPRELTNQLCHGLEALDMGETQELLQRMKYKSLAGYSLWRLRFDAINYINFRRGIKQTKKDAIDKVAKAYGCSTDAVESWEKSLPEQFGSGLVKYTNRRVRQDGELVYYLQQTVPKIEKGEEWIAYYLKLYGDTALSRSGKEYRTVLRETGKRG